MEQGKPADGKTMWVRHLIDDMQGLISLLFPLKTNLQFGMYSGKYVTKM